METFPAQPPEKSPEVHIDDDDDDSPESKAERKSNRKETTTRSVESENKKDPDTQDRKRPEKPKNNDGEIPLEALADDELKMVAQQYLDDRTEALKAELAGVPAQSPEEAAALANAALLETIEAKLSGGETADEETLKDAVAETAQELGIELPDKTEDTTEQGQENQTETAPENNGSDTEDDDDQQTAVPTTATNTATGSPPPHAAAPAGSATPVAPGPSPTVAPGGGAGGAGGPPLTPSHGYYGGIPHIPNYNVPVGASPNGSLPSPPNTPEQHVIIKHNAAAPYLLLGYLIGRRRGRIKTEEKLLPIQHKLEKEVTDLHKKIAGSEEKIRSLAREKAAVKPAIAEKIAERLERKHKRMAEASEIPAAEKLPKPEDLGKLAIKPERSEPVPMLAELEKPKRPEPLKAPERPKTPEHMTVAELLIIAEHIPAEYGSVKKLYETHIIDEEGLRQVAKAYLRGERYEKVIRENRKMPETDFTDSPEKDPRFSQSSASYDSADPASASTHKGSWTADPTTNRQPPQAVSTSKDRKDTARPAVTTQTVLIVAVVIAAVALILFILR